MGLKAEDAEIIKHIYQNYYGAIKVMVTNFNNKILDPEDIFPEGMVRMILNIRDGKFKGQSSVFTYLNGICRNICLKKLNKDEKYIPVADDFADETETYDEHYDELNNVLKIFLCWIIWN